MPEATPTQPANADIAPKDFQKIARWSADMAEALIEAARPRMMTTQTPGLALAIVRVAERAYELGRRRHRLSSGEAQPVANVVAEDVPADRQPSTSSVDLPAALGALEQIDRMRFALQVIAAGETTDPAQMARVALVPSNGEPR